VWFNRIPQINRLTIGAINKGIPGVGKTGGNSSTGRTNIKVLLKFPGARQVKIPATTENKQIKKQ
jgi:hypothetical protein